MRIIAILFSVYLLSCLLTGSIHVRVTGRAGLAPLYRRENPKDFWRLFFSACLADAFILSVSLPASLSKCQTDVDSEAIHFRQNLKILAIE